MLRHSLLLSIGLLALFVPTAHADTILYEGFDYGKSDAALDGLGSAEAGWAGSWDVSHVAMSGSPSYSADFEAVGLSLSDLPVSGGGMLLTNDCNGTVFASRQHAASLTGTLYGSYLFQPVTRPTQAVGVCGLFESHLPQASGSMAQFAIDPDAYGSDNGGVMTGGAYNFASGSALVAGETYLVLFEVTGLGMTSTARSATMWILNEDQFDYHKAGGLDAAELNAAPVGSGSTAVQQRATRSVSTGYAFASDRYLTFQNYYFGNQARYDELRISNSSLNETIVPEPCGLVILAAGAAIVAVYRRHSPISGA